MGYATLWDEIHKKKKTKPGLDGSVFWRDLFTIDVPVVVPAVVNTECEWEFPICFFTWNDVRKTGKKYIIYAIVTLDNTRKSNRVIIFILKLGTFPISISIRSKTGMTGVTLFLHADMLSTFGRSRTFLICRKLIGQLQLLRRKPLPAIYSLYN